MMTWRRVGSVVLMAVAAVFIACDRPRSTIASSYCPRIVGRPTATLFRATLPDSTLAGKAAASIVVRIVTTRDNRGTIVREPINLRGLHYMWIDEAVFKWRSQLTPYADRGIHRIDSLVPGGQYVFRAVSVGNTPHAGWIVAREGFLDTLELDIPAPAVCFLATAR